MKLHLWPKWLLLASNSVLWGAPGINILLTGIKTRKELDNPNLWVAGGIALLVFIAFHFMFTAIVKRNSRFVKDQKGDRAPFWKMMPVRTWIVLFFMMGLGIFLKVSGVAPAYFTTIFYTGLGLALIEAAVRFLVSIWQP